MSNTRGVVTAASVPEPSPPGGGDPTNKPAYMGPHAAKNADIENTAVLTAAETRADLTRAGDLTPTKKKEDENLDDASKRLIFTTPPPSSFGAAWKAKVRQRGLDEEKKQAAAAEEQLRVASEEASVWSASSKEAAETLRQPNLLLVVADAASTESLRASLTTIMAKSETRRVCGDSQGGRQPRHRHAAL